MGALEGKVAIITGGAGGQGSAEARLFVNEGASVVATDIDEKRGRALVAELGDAVVFARHDITSAEDWARVVKLACDRFGGIDILVNNAGIVAYGSVEEIKEAELRRLFDVNFYGAFLGVQAVVTPMTKRGGGAIVNTVSAAALRGYAGNFGYGVSKWALRGLSRYCAVDLVKKRIRVNAILSGAVETEMINRPEAASVLAAAKATVPMNRFAEPEEIARLALFLASDASSYMAGSELVADGGMSA
jgi:3alpha(or 20beta)-hydroxysteroid dehydrogenase